MQKRLTNRPATVRIESLQDLFTVVVGNIESSMIESGAQEGEYTLLDLYKLAQPFVMQRWSTEESLELVIG